MAHRDPGLRLLPARFDDLPGWRSDRMAPAFSAFRLSAFRDGVKPYRTASSGISPALLRPAFDAVRQNEALDDDDARRFFEAHFCPWRVDPPGGSGFVTGFYEPELAASPVETGDFPIPLLGVPDDLVAVDDDNRPPGFDPATAFARRTDDGLAAYHDREAIERGALKGKAEPIAWVADRVDAFFVHVQGAARLVMQDGSVRRITYAAKSGHPFTGPGGVLARIGEIARRDVTMQSIRAWFRANPGRVDEILWQNRSYIFFREAPVEDEEMGPVAAAKVPLTPGRSLAVDRLIHTFGTPFFIDAPALAAGGAAPFRRLMIAQDTGSAIIGPARGDLFMGSGAGAGEIAGRIKHDADFYLLAPTGFVPETGA